MNSEGPAGVTVIVPCYNHEKFINKCVKSILGQTYQNVDLVVVDDGSTDKSLALLQELKKTSNFTLRTQSNKGLVGTLNEVLQNHPLQKYVCFLASDDYWPADKLEKQVQYMESHNDCYLSFGNYVEVASDGKVLEHIRCRPPKSNYFSELLLSNYIPGATAMLRSEVFKSVGYFDENYRIEDWYLWLKILKQFPSLGYVDTQLAYYRLHPGNFSKNVDLMTNESLKLLKLYENEPYYKAAVSIVWSKHIVKSFLVSFSSGTKALREGLSLKNLLALFQCFIKGQGPFRKVKFLYWNFR